MHNFITRKILFVTFCLLSVTVGKTQSVGIGTESPDSSAILDLTNPDHKGLLIPSMTTAQKNAIEDPANGLLVYQLDSIPGFYAYDGTAWQRVGRGGNAWGETTAMLYTSKVVSVGNSSPNSSAILDLSNANNKGILIPSMTAAAKDAIDDPADGLLIYQSDSIPGFYFFDSEVWDRIGGGGNAWEETDSTVYTSKFVGVNTDTPYNPLDVHGNMVITQSTITTESVPTPAQVKNMINNFQIEYSVSDSTGRIFDPGGPNGQYGANTSNSTCQIHPFGNYIGIELIIEQIDLGVGDSLIIRYDSNVGDIAYSLGHQNSHEGVYIINATGMHLLFKSDASPSTLGDGFSLLFKRMTMDTNALETKGFAGYSLIFNSANGSLRGGSIANNSTSGLRSFSFGNNNKAVGTNSIALGSFNSSSNTNSIALGSNNNSLGSATLAMGTLNMAGSVSLAAIGEQNSSTGFKSVSIGSLNNAAGDYSLAFGRQNNATGNDSYSIGAFNTAQGDNSYVLGRENSSTGASSTSIGFRNTTSGGQSLAMGRDNYATGGFSTIIGTENNATGSYSCAIGYENESTGYISLSLGFHNLAEGGYASAFGHNTTASGWNSNTNGIETIANGFACTAIGMYNAPISTPQSSIAEDTPLFIVGNGSNEANRTNAMVVRKDGNVGLGTNNPRITLHVADGTDAGLEDADGFVLIGNANGINMVMDDNEIQARNNGAISNFYLQKDGGSVFIGTPVTPSFLLSVNGTAGKNGGGSWSTYSDRRLKENIHAYADGLNELLKIKPVWFQYNSMSGYNTNDKYVGVIAQELQEVSPYMVTAPTTTLADGSPGYLQVDNSAMTYMLINAVKELHAEIENLKSEIQELRKSE